MMNMGIYFRLGAWRALTSQILLWKGFYRPMGAGFYLPLYHWFGLNPAPFQAAILALLAANVYLTFRLAKALRCGGLVSALAAVAIAYHAGLTSLVYQIDMVYDVLCFGFFVGALLLYVHIRGQRRYPRLQETTAFLALYICALNSKEMAFTLPAILLAYECFYQFSRSPERKAPEGWVRGSGILILTMVGLGLLDLYGKKSGVMPLLGNPDYRPVFSLRRFFEFQSNSLHDLLGAFGTPGWRGVLAIWALVTYLAWRRDRPVLRFCWAYMLITPAPIAFLVGRTQGSLYIVLAGWAIFAAVVLVDVAQKAAGFLAQEPVFERLGRTWLFALLIGGSVLLWGNRMRYLKTALVEPAAAIQGIQTSEVIEQLRQLDARVPPHSQVVFLDDPFEDWDMTFIGTLWFRDRSIQVHTQRLERLPEKDLARMDYVFDFRDGRLVRIK